ncbi:hypothetical protein DENSPDRAFT_816148 [Dentipellis sp. KUC8613]|nr:hypothetical protein DENSPDRAFT_816148 [Dentipellis sp. KUC8613]
MARSLRPRKQRPSYASVYAEEDEDGAGPSAAAEFDEEGSGSDFAPPDAEASEDEDVPDADAVNEDEDGGFAPEDDNGPSFTPAAKGKGKSRSRASTKKPRDTKPSPSASFGAGLVRPATSRQMYSLPTPSVHHRHKAIPIFRHPGPVERLVNPPVLFGENETLVTNSYTSDAVVTDRMNKAWGFNVGPGPLWELMEDRGWYKEGENNKEEPGLEATRRPRVHEDINLHDGLSVLSYQDAARYLPTEGGAHAASETPQPAASVPCFFGPFGKQTLAQMNTFDALPISQFIPESGSHVFNAGGPIWGLDWCPIHPADRPHCSYKQYLAVAPFPSKTHSPEVGIKATGPSPACIQIWSLGPSAPEGNIDAPETETEDRGAMRCEMVLCIDSGPAYELKWCPLPSNDPLSEAAPGAAAKPRKLGLLAGIFEDGSMSIHAVPYPADLHAAGNDPTRPVFVKLTDPLVRIELDEACCWTIDWANSERIAIGCTNGVIAVYNIATGLKASQSQGPNQNPLPSHYIPVHQAAIRALSWIRAPPQSASGDVCMDENPTVIASGGYDGVECLTDIREPTGNIMNRTRDVINTIPFSPYAGGPITIDHENIVKAYSASPSMLGRGHTLMEPLGPVWCTAPSDYHPQLAVGSADGCCGTTNMLRSTRRGGSVPFLMHKVYQLDYSRSTQTFRMLERFLPQEVPDRSSATVRAKKGSAPPPVGTGAWSAEVGVLRAVWHAGGGLGAAQLLASGTASGLGRVDVLRGRWLREKVPYGGVEAMRREVDAMDVDVEDEDVDADADADADSS